MSTGYNLQQVHPSHVRFMLMQIQSLQKQVANLERRIGVQDALYRVLLEILVKHKEVFTMEELEQISQAHAQAVLAGDVTRISEMDEVEAKVKNIRRTIER